MKFVYVAFPFSHPDPAVEAERVRQVIAFMATMIRERTDYRPISPVIHCYEIAKASGLNGSWETWQPYCLKFLDICDLMVVLKLPGWIESVGVQAECEEAASRKMPVLFSETDLGYPNISESLRSLSGQ